MKLEINISQPKNLFVAPPIFAYLVKEIKHKKGALDSVQVRFLLDIDEI